MANQSTGTLITPAAVKRERRHGLRQSLSQSNYIRRTLTIFRNHLEADLIALHGRLDVNLACMVQSASGSLQRALHVEDGIRQLESRSLLSVDDLLKIDDLRKRRDDAFARRDDRVKQAYAYKNPAKANGGTSDLIPRSEIINELRALIAEAQRSPALKRQIPPELQRVQSDMLADLKHKRQAASRGVLDGDEPAVNAGPNDSDSVTDPAS
ncbi:MAG TPA: hypothetical protein VFG04_02930 [Planctomycetaceae bacterium]|jgi:hypothetical protein|nr:hypothetical protein [Planctomycetaceae bacterium]